MKNHYTVRLSRIDKSEFGTAPIVGGNYNAHLHVVAASAEEACRFALEHMVKKTADCDWKVHSLDLDDEYGTCAGPARY